MVDLTDRPALVHAAVERLARAWIVELDQLEGMNLLSLDCNNTRIGSGGYGYSRELPGADFDPLWVKPHNMWGCSNAQIFSGVSPEMHWEFAVEHDLPWLSRWGLSYYGCCEALDGKMDILRRVPNLRKVSGSPWCNVKRLIDKIGADYVISRKPNPAVLAHDAWQPEVAREELESFLEATEGNCHVEFIMKDISTVRRQPQRLWEWASIAMDVVQNFVEKK